MAEPIDLTSQSTPQRSSFFLPMWFMSPGRRRALHSLYDFCRAVDDAVDEVASPEEARAGLEAWTYELHGIYHGTPVHRVARELQDTAREYNIPEGVLQEMMKGFETDCAASVALNDDAALEQYCYRVAGCVGIASLPIFGVSMQDYTKFAVALGHALQLTNILRDLDEDLASGRCYIPASLLAQFDITAKDTDASFATKWDQAAAELAGQAEAYFKKTHALVKSKDQRKLIPALLMRDAYQLLLGRMRASGKYFHKPAKVKRQPGDVMRLLMNGIRYYF